MELFLWRHADALPGILSDFERELSPRGHQQAGMAAKWLSEQIQSADLANMRILVSPAVRTRQTAAHFCKDENNIQLCQALYDNVPPREILDILGWPNITLPALVVGHEPLMGILAGRLLAGAPRPDTFRKSALWHLRIESGKGKAQLVDFVEP